MERANALTNLRPILDLEHTSNQSHIERFQNDVIRPILKFQHEIILSLVQDHRFFKKSMQSTNTQDEYRLALKAFLNTQKELRNQLIGLVIGLLTIEEYNTYVKASAEYQRRILHMINQRVFDTIGPK